MGQAERALTRTCVRRQLRKALRLEKRQSHLPWVTLWHHQDARGWANTASIDSIEMPAASKFSLRWPARFRNGKTSTGWLKAPVSTSSRPFGVSSTATFWPKRKGWVLRKRERKEPYYVLSGMRRGFVSTTWGPSESTSPRMDPNLKDGVVGLELHCARTHAWKNGIKVRRKMWCGMVLPGRLTMNSLKAITCECPCGNESRASLYSRFVISKRSKTVSRR